MKFLSNIFFLLLLVSAGNIHAEEFAGRQDNINPKLFSVNYFTCHNSALQEDMLEAQDSNEMDSFDACFISATPTINPQPKSVQIKSRANSAFYSFQLNSFLIDLPPPSLS